MFVFGKIEINGKANVAILQRVGVCAVRSFLLTVILGLPILGFIHPLGY